MSEVTGMGTPMSPGVQSSVGGGVQSARGGTESVAHAVHTVPPKNQGGTDVNIPSAIKDKSSSSGGKKSPGSINGEIVSTPESKKVGAELPGGAKKDKNSESFYSEEFTEKVLRVAKEEGLDAALEMLARGEVNEEVGQNVNGAIDESEDAKKDKKEKVAPDLVEDDVQAPEAINGERKTEKPGDDIQEAPYDPKVIEMASRIVKMAERSRNAGREIGNTGEYMSPADYYRMMLLLEEMMKEEKDPKKKVTLFDMLLMLIGEFLRGTFVESGQAVAKDVGESAAA